MTPLRAKAGDPSADFDVAIVGYGPTGAVAAALLAQAGHRVFVCDRDGEVYDKPRAISLDHEILRLFQQLGIADAVLPHTAPFTDSCHHGVDGALIRRMTMLAPPHPQAWTPSVVFHQPAVERALRAGVARLPQASVALGCALLGLQQDADRVHLALSDGRTVSARWAIGCDGASSRVRSLCGLQLQDLGFDEPWLVADVLVHDHGLARLPVTSMQYCEPARPCSYLIGTGRHRRWEIALHADEDAQHAATPEGTWALLKRWLAPHEGQLWRQASYRFHALVAQRWRAGRVFIAGDAAHQQPPFLGQGMCQGLRDAANLSWKLDAVLAGRGSQALLDSYGTERRSHVHALTTRLKAIGAAICERDPERARLRDQRLLAEAGGAVRPLPRQDLMPGLETGVLATDGGTARGCLFPQPWLRGAGPQERVRMDDACGRGWRLVWAPSVAAPVQIPAARQLALRWLVGLDEADGLLAAWFDQHRCVAALVRPDHHVFGTAAHEDGVRALLDQAAAWLGPQAGAPAGRQANILEQ